MTPSGGQGKTCRPGSDPDRGQRIGILLPDFRAGGAERVAISLARGFAAAGYRPEFIVLQARGEYLSEIAEVFPVRALGSWRFRQVLPALAGLLRCDPPDALLVHMWPLTAIAAAAAWLARYRGRVVAVEHGFTPKAVWHRVASVLCFRLPVTVVAVSAGLAAAKEAFALLPRGRIMTLTNPIEPPGPCDAAALHRAEAVWRGTPRGGRILSVGRLVPVKDQATLVRALARLPETCRLMIVGHGPEEAALRALAEALGLSDRVILTGFQPDPAPFYRTADVFALSSVTEGFGNVLVEAMACGLPVVSTDCPFGPAEILDGGRYGRLVAVGDDAALASALAGALADPGDPAARLARAGRFSVEAAVDRYLTLLFGKSGAGQQA